MPLKRFDILFSSKALVAVIAGLLLMLGLILVAQGFIDARDYRQTISRLVKEKTGQELVVRGKVSVSLLPTPMIYMQDAEISNPRSKVATPVLTMAGVRLKPALFSLFSDDPRISSVALEKPVLDVQRAHDGVIYWDWLDLSLLKLIAAPSEGESMSVAVTGGRVLYRNNMTDRQTMVEDVTLDGALGGGSRFSGGFSVAGHALRVSLNVVPKAPGHPEFDLVVSAGDKNRAQWQGEADLSADPLRMTGKMSLAVEDISEWLQAKNAGRPNLFEKITNLAPGQEVAKTTLPFSISAEWRQAGWETTLEKTEMKGLNSEGAGTLDIAWGNKISVGADMAFSAFDSNQWRALLEKTLVTSPAADTYQGDFTMPSVLPRGLGVKLKLSADTLYFGTQTWQNARLSAELDRGAVTVNQFSLRLPGESSMTLFGVISQSNTGTLRFEGSMETEGKSLRQMMTVLDPSAAGLPETGFGAFFAHANIFVSPEQVRLSEADVKISDLRLSGGMVAYYDARPRVEADVNLRDINFDYFRDVWRREKKPEKGQDFFLRFGSGMNFDWLKRLQTSIDFKVHVNGFTFLDRQGESASFRIFAEQGGFGIYNMRFNYPTETTEANFTIDVKGEQPLFNVLLNTSELDTAYFMRDGKKKEAEETPDESPVKPQDRWSKELLDMSWMEGVNTSFDLSVGNLSHGRRSFGNVKMRAKLENNLLAFQALSFSYWQGRCDVSGSLYGGKVPGVSIGFTYYSAELKDMLGELFDRENISGRVSMSGTLSTSGVNLLSWLNQSEAKLVMAGRGISVGGVSLQGVVDAVAVSRTAADVFNNVNLALPEGATEFDVDGNINGRGGVLKTPGITLKAGSVLGNLTGEVRLEPWTMDLSTFFQFPGLSSETVPTMTVQVIGPIATPELRTDTSSLEAYVAKRIIGR